MTHCDCRHPLDQQNTRLLKILPGLEAMAKNVLGNDSPYQAIRVHRHAASDVHLRNFLQVLSLVLKK